VTETMFYRWKQQDTGLDVRECVALEVARGRQPLATPHQCGAAILSSIPSERRLPASVVTLKN